MQHIKVTFRIEDAEERDIIAALLGGIGYEGFEETDTELIAYIAEAVFEKEEVAALAFERGVMFTTEVIPERNWNEVWESNFEPVIVEGLCTIRAHFHHISVSTPNEIVITPKMSFGTGHHATTQLVMLMMSELDLSGEDVLDLGTGTGVLAILAEQLGAEKVTAIDNDEWSVENAIENIDRNACQNIGVHLGSLELVYGRSYDVILANINRHILLQYMQDMYQLLKVGGKIIMSGLLVEDEQVIKDAAKTAGLSSVKMMEKNNWIAIVFSK
jgi:ribosomal protein L11 methyltransferase